MASIDKDPDESTFPYHTYKLEEANEGLAPDSGKMLNHPLDDAHRLACEDALHVFDGPDSFILLEVEEANLVKAMFVIPYCSFLG